jgi:Superinfection immunity protein
MTGQVILASGSSIVGLIIVLLLYFIPSVVAFVRHRHNQWAIFALNLLLG